MSAFMQRHWWIGYEHGYTGRAPLTDVEVSPSPREIADYKAGYRTGVETVEQTCPLPKEEDRPHVTDHPHWREHWRGF